MVQLKQKTIGNSESLLICIYGFKQQYIIGQTVLIIIIELHCNDVF